MLLQTVTATNPRASMELHSLKISGRYARLSANDEIFYTRGNWVFFSFITCGKVRTLNYKSCEPYEDCLLGEPFTPCNYCYNSTLKEVRGISQTKLKVVGL